MRVGIAIFVILIIFVAVIIVGFCLDKDCLTATGFIGGGVVLFIYLGVMFMGYKQPRKESEVAPTMVIDPYIVINERDQYCTDSAIGNIHETCKGKDDYYSKTPIKEGNESCWQNQCVDKELMTERFNTSPAPSVDMATKANQYAKWNDIKLA